VPLGAPVDGFRLAYDRQGDGSPVVLLHGWPGTRRDYRAVLALLSGDADLVAPDLRGFGGSDRHDRPPEEAYSATAQAESVLGLITELRLDRPVLVGYDVGSRVAQAIARTAPEAVRALVLSPPLPGVGDRILSAEAQREFWYQPFHRLALADELVGDDPPAVRAYLRHFWEHWSAPGWSLDPEELERLVDAYGAPGAFRASIGWYRAGAGAVAHSLGERAPPPDERIATPTLVLWGEQEPLFPLDWSDRLEHWFSSFRLSAIAGVGHFAPLEAPGAVAEAVREALGARRREHEGAP
jgi:pimeloyl-ACP methyl ester carboxylesterase